MRKLKFPDRFFSVHYNRMLAIVDQSPGSTKFGIMTRENYDDWFNQTVPRFVVNFIVVHKDGNRHVVPAKPEDVETAEKWEQRYSKVDDDEFVD